MDLYPNIILFVAVIIAVTAIIISKIFTDARIKQKLIDQGMVDEKDNQLFWKRPREHPMVYLKWLIFIMAFFIPIGLRLGFSSIISPEFLVVLLIVFPAAAIFIYYKIAKKEYDSSTTEKEI